MAGYQTIEALRPILHRGPVPMPVVDRALVGRPEAIGRSRKREISPETQARIAAMREGGSSLRQIRAALNVSFYSARYYSQHIAPPTNVGGRYSAAHKGKDKTDAFARRLRRAGFSYREIAVELGVSYSQAYYIFNPRAGKRVYECRDKMVERVSVITGFPSAKLRRGGPEDCHWAGEQARARHLLFWLLRRYRTDLSLSGIGRRCGGFNHSSVRIGIMRADRVAAAIGLPEDVRPLSACRRLWAAEWPEASACR